MPLTLEQLFLRSCFLLPPDSNLPSVRLTTPDFETKMPSGAWVCASTFAFYTTRVLGGKNCVSLNLAMTLPLRRRHVALSVRYSQITDDTKCNVLFVGHTNFELNLVIIFLLLSFSCTVILAAQYQLVHACQNPGCFA